MAVSMTEVNNVYDEPVRSEKLTTRIFNRIKNTVFNDVDMEDNEHRPAYEVNVNAEDMRLNEFPNRNAAWNRRSYRTNPTETEAAAPDTMYNHRIVSLQPYSLEAARNIIAQVRNNNSVICNFEGMDEKSSELAYCFISGGASALSAGFQQVSKYIFVLTPRSVVMINGMNEEEKRYRSENDMER